MVDRLNECSYSFHYRSLDSTECYALKALANSAHYADGRAEAYNNLAFVCIARMDYNKAYALLDSVNAATDNQIELLIADIQGMRLCQRTSKNKEFYDYNERARLRLRRVEEEKRLLSGRLSLRYIYAKSEYHIVRSTYYYYVGIQKQSANAIDSIFVPELQRDTAQYLNYLYQIGSGGIITNKSAYETCKAEFEKLIECYMLASRGGYKYWEANSLQSISEHLSDSEQRLWHMADNPVAIKYLNRDDMPDSLLSGYLAQRSLEIFMSYGDIYQTAGASRTLATCYWAIGDYTSSLICLKNALADKRIMQAPDLVSSIYEQLSLTYSALDDKADSDINRNSYLDIQETTRQDRQLEARADQLERISTQLNILAGFILFLLILVVVLIAVLYYIRRKKSRSEVTEKLLRPLRKWEQLNKQYFKNLADKREELQETITMEQISIEDNKKRNVENRAKIFLANSITPYIDRIVNEAERLQNTNENDNLRRERIDYITELTNKINECNTVLTSWIQLRKGQLGIKIESFRLQDVFSIVARSAMSFKIKGLTFEVEPTTTVVKADRTLTLFMLNTLADNARKFTEKGGTVKISATETADYVEVSVEDSGKGLSESELKAIFNRSLNGGHGFGLLNCRGIIEKYKKISQIFSVCGLYADSKQGRGSRFYFRLPRGVVHLLLCLLMAFTWTESSAQIRRHAVKNDTVVSNIGDAELRSAGAYADSAYFCNVSGLYDSTFVYADRAIKMLNSCYKARYPSGRNFMSIGDDGSDSPAELQWYRDSVKVDYSIILDLRNECAVAALALHQWDAYRYNNKIYTQLFKLRSADSGLAEYCRTMQRSSSNKAIAVIVLVLLLVSAVVSFYFIYYRHVLYFRFCADNVGNINGILLSDSDNADKLQAIQETDTSKYPEPLKVVVDTIVAALRLSVDEHGRSLTDLELASDELRRTGYEKDKLYVCNNITDNCLSALKHETMYYPSRINQIVDSPDFDVVALREVAGYYRELSVILSRQAVDIAQGIKYECKPVEVQLSDGSGVTIIGDSVFVNYLFDILRKQNGGVAPVLSILNRNGRYVALQALCNCIHISQGECDSLFTPAVNNIPYLICRQIVRDIGEATNLHACGITATATAEGLSLKLTLAAIDTLTNR